jgi:type IV pilus assembly protein PilQ
MMRKSYFSFLSFLLLFSLLFSGFLVAGDVVSLKNLSWEEQTNMTRIILETSSPLIYNVTASGNGSELQVELSNLDLRNLPQELFINTDQVVSLQTFPQTDTQKARIIVKMTAFLSHEVTMDGSKMYIDVEGNPSGGDLVTPVSPATVAPPVPEKQVEAIPVPLSPQESNLKPAPVSKPEISHPRPAAAPASVAAATRISDIRVQRAENTADVVLVGDGAFKYDVFELSNPQRLVVDLNSVVVAPSVKSVITSDHDLFSRIRVAQFQTTPTRVARAVIDLNKKTPYSISEEGTELHVVLGQATSSSDNETQKQEASPVVAQAADPAPVPPPAFVTPAPATVDEEPAQTAFAPAVQESTKPDAKEAAAGSMKNEQFFAIQPDTSLFAQDEGSTAPPPADTPPQSSGQTGMGSFEEKTVKGGDKQYTGEPFSFDFKDIDIADLFRFIADISGLNVILDPQVKGSVTLKLTEVPWDQALDLITKNQGLGYAIEGNVIRIAPLSRIAAEERQRAEANRQQMLSAPLMTKIKPLSYAKAMEVDKVVKRLLTEKGSSITDVRTNTIIITDIDTNIDAIVNLIDTLDSRTTQVLIEARIVETNRSFEQAFGIQWGFRGIVDPAFGNNTTLQFPNNTLIDGSTIKSQSGISGNPLDGYAVNLPTNQGANTGIAISMGNILDTFRLDVALSALETTGNGRILSSPKVATQNNIRAEILQGEQIPLQTVSNNTITTQLVNAALRLAVTPQITAEGTIIMEVEVENNRPDFAHVTLSGTPSIITESAQTTLLVEDGGTTVIGGIFRATDEYAQSRTPMLHRIPLLGWMFKNQNISRSNRELLIFLTPRILR